MLRRPLLAVVLFASSVAAGCEAETATQGDAPPKWTKPQAPTPPEAPVEVDTPPPVESAEPQGARPKTSGSLAAATELAEAIWADERRTFLCACPFSEDGRVNHAGCGYAPRADDEAARRLSWTHVVPAREFGASRACWSQPNCKDAAGAVVSGVGCCAATDAEFLVMYTDLNNLVPMIQEVANDRAGLPFGEIDGKSGMYGRCDFSVDTERGLAAPPERRRGEVARAYLYMEATYPEAIGVSPLQRRRLEAWAADDPPEPAEVARGRAITKLQGVAHPWLSEGAAPAGGDVAAAAEDAEAPPTAPVDDAKAPAKDAKAPADDAKAPAKDAKAPAAGELEAPSDAKAGEVAASGG
jgi:deoxyribonuclease-1